MSKGSAGKVAATASLVIDGLEKAPGSSAAAIAEATGLGRSTVTRKLAELEKVGLASRTPGEREAGVRTPDLWKLVKKAAGSRGSKASAGNAPSGTAKASGPKGRSASARESDQSGPRLQRGELGRLVRDYLDTHPGPHSPSEIASDLQRSAGAVANALVRLVDETEALLIQVSPKRYQSTEEQLRRRSNASDK